MKLSQSRQNRSLLQLPDAGEVLPNFRGGEQRPFTGEDQPTPQQMEYLLELRSQTVEDHPTPEQMEYLLELRSQTGEDHPKLLQMEY